VRKHEKTISITSESRARDEKAMECTRCMDIRPNGATYYHLIGTEIGVRPIFVVLGTPKRIVYPIYPLKSTTPDVANALSWASN
jgi:septum formation inhibitor-activating ATPase MinD